MLFTIDNLGEFGVLRDGLAHELPDNAWSDGRNVRFREGYAEKFLGHTEPFGNSTVTPYHVLPLAQATAYWWIEAGLAKIYSVDSTATHVNITRQTTGADVNYTGTADTGWTSTALGGIAVLNNSVDVPQFWAGTGKCADLTNWPSTLRAKSVRAYRAFLVALNCTKSSTPYPHLVKWSHSADPGSVPSSWDETDATKDCGEFDLADHPSVLVDGMVLGDSLILYKEGAYYALTDVGGQSIMRSQMLSSQAGALTKNCIAAFSGGHCVLGAGDVVVHTGGPCESILTSRARRWLYANIDSTYYVRSFLATNPATSEVWICFPTSGATQPNVALVWNYKANTLGTRELAAWHANQGVVAVSPSDAWSAGSESWDATADLWDQTSIAKSTQRLVLAASNMQLADSSAMFAGTPFTARLERSGLSLGTPERIKLFRGLRPIFEAPDGAQLSIQLGAADSAGGSITWAAATTFTVGTTLQADAIACGRFLALRIESSSDVSWRLKRMELDVEVMGAY